MPSKQREANGVPYARLSHHQNVVVLAFQHRLLPYDLYLRRCFLFLSAVLLLSTIVFFFYPSDPQLDLARIGLNHIRVNSSPKLTLDLSFSLTVKVHNRNFLYMDYDELIVLLGYRGGELGRVRSEGGRVKARQSSYVNATLDLDGLEIIQDVFYLIGDLAKGVIPFDTDTSVDGGLGLFSFKIPFRGRVLCEVDVNIHSQTIQRQDCHPAVRALFS